jgi:ABC-type glycerol-3-phosphate transport system substrate-binding protein
LGKVRLTAAVTASLVAALALAACGGNGNSADEDQITAVLTRAATSGDPAVCTQDQTLKFTEQTSGGAKGQAAVKACEKDAKSTAAEKIDVTDVKVDGDTATATAKATGSIFDGQTISVALVKQGDRWKLDEFKGFEDFNKDAMINAFKQQISSEPGATPQAVDCIVSQFQKASDQTIEDTFTNSNSQAENQLFGPCGKYFKGNG